MDTVWIKCGFTAHSLTTQQATEAALEVLPTLLARLSEHAGGPVQHADPLKVTTWDLEPTARDLARQLQEALGGNEGPLGKCALPRGGGCVARRSSPAHGSRQDYCESCWGYVLASRLYGLLWSR